MKHDEILYEDEFRTFVVMTTSLFTDFKEHQHLVYENNKYDRPESRWRPFDTREDALKFGKSLVKDYKLFKRTKGVE